LSTTIHAARAVRDTAEIRLLLDTLDVCVTFWRLNVDRCAGFSSSTTRPGPYACGT
jgi:hypothetical protein